jgi:hypothetical protein
MVNYRWSVCLPDNPEVIEKGNISREDILTTFLEFSWTDYLRKMATMKEKDIHYSPSLEFENKDTRQGVTFSIVGDEFKNEFYIFYKRHKTVKSFFGLFSREVDDHVSDITGQTKEDAIKFLTAFLNNDADYMESKMK